MPDKNLDGMKIAMKKLLLELHEYPKYQHYLWKHAAFTFFMNAFFQDLNMLLMRGYKEGKVLYQQGHLKHGVLVIMMMNIWDTMVTVFIKGQKTFI